MEKKFLNAEVVSGNVHYANIYCNMRHKDYSAFNEDAYTRACLTSGNKLQFEFENGNIAIIEPSGKVYLYKAGADDQPQAGQITTIGEKPVLIFDTWTQFVAYHLAKYW